MKDKEEQFMQAYTVKEVSEIIDVPAGTIRHWEKSLPGILVIQRDEKGARYYTDFEINILKNIKAMRDKGLQFNVIRQVLEQSEPSTTVPIESVPTMTQSEAVQTIRDMHNALEHLQNHIQNTIQKEVQRQVASASERIESNLERRDQLLMKTLREIQETKKIINKKKWWQFWK